MAWFTVSKANDSPQFRRKQLSRAAFILRPRYFDRIEREAIHDRNIIPSLLRAAEHVAKEFVRFKVMKHSDYGYRFYDFNLIQLFAYNIR